MNHWRRAPRPGENPASAAERRHARYLLNTRLTVTPTKESPNAIQSRALDMSESGVGGLSDESWNVGTRVQLEVSLPVDTTVLRMGRWFAIILG